MEPSGKKSQRKIKQIKLRRIKGIRERRGAFLLPSLLTTGNMFCGFVAIICVFNSFFHPGMKTLYVEYASILILVSILLDALDGRVARLTNTASPFGLEYDSLADLVSFGIAPGLLAYAYALIPFGRLGWSSAFLFLVCGAMRLARYNITTTTMDKKYSMGLPIPVAAGMIASLVLIAPEPVIDSTIYSTGIIGLLYVLSYLMVSKIRYRTFKELDFSERRSTRIIVILAIFFLVFTTHESTIFITGLMYVLSGPFMKLFGRSKLQVGLDAQQAQSSGKNKIG